VTHSIVQRLIENIEDREMMRKIIPACLAVSLSAITTASVAQDAGTATPATLSGAYTGKVYSPPGGLAARYN
jgi:hypothetical protein